MSLYAALAPDGPSGFGYGTTAEQVTEGLSLDGRTILLTGCNSGLGHEAMRVLALRGATVVGTARTLEKATAAANAVQGKTIPLACELSDLASVRACVQQVRELGLTLDAILCNAGIMALPKLQRVHGYEAQFFTNHIGHFLLVTGLLDQLAGDGRVVILSSAAHRMAPKGGIAFDNLKGDKGYQAWSAYGQSKFADLLFAKELARRFAGTSRTANAVHPGVIATNLMRHLGLGTRLAWSLGGLLAFKSIPQGAATEVYAAVHPSLAGISGTYLADCNVSRARADADDAETARRLWQVSEEIVASL
jgi:NAD(P)-dependent dehydrogenase (short-subunit alcohol dehydrogenase family)